MHSIDWVSNGLRPASPIKEHGSSARQVAVFIAALVLVAGCRDASRAGLLATPGGGRAQPVRATEKPTDEATGAAAVPVTPLAISGPTAPEHEPTDSPAPGGAAGQATPVDALTPDSETGTLTPRAPSGSGQTPDVTVPELGPDSPRAALSGVRHVWQKWNNCGPSAILMALSGFGIELDQMAVADQLKPDREDTNVTPEELAGFARGQGLEAVTRVHGDRATLRRLILAGVPVVVEHWIDVEGRGEMGHYRTVVGFDDELASFTVQDSYYGPLRRYGYDEFDAMWRPFVGAYVVAYLPDQERAVFDAIGTDPDPLVMWQEALRDHEAWAAAEPDSAWAWFTLGEIRSRLGQHEAAVAAFERAVAIGLPFRAFWYQFGFYRSLAALGEYERLIAHAEATAATMDGENLEETHYWRGVALRELGREQEARESFGTALAYNPLFAPAREALGE